ncbi:hypothetical protein DPMN_126496 [Dreissena polymorpha]|uniref:Uncharacterized protein n=1 Tax=Dreissena polymorpha TaxID=45954 RepID=A0A9D4H3G8_DREPO|nr:hypothetical protein DPMN_126496 [Dreissena polymorpha]
MSMATPTLWFEAFNTVTTVRGAAVENKNTTDTSAKHIVALVAARLVLTNALFMMFESVGAKRAAFRSFGMMLT